MSLELVQVHGTTCTRLARARRCASCGAPGVFVCDHVVLGGAFTCGAPLCPSCAHELGPDDHRCREHAPPEAHDRQREEIRRAAEARWGQLEGPLVVHVTGGLEVAETAAALGARLLEALERALSRAAQSMRVLVVLVHGGESLHRAVVTWARRRGSRAPFVGLVDGGTDAADEEVDAEVQGDACLVVGWDTWFGRRAGRTLAVGHVTVDGVAWRPAPRRKAS